MGLSRAQALASRVGLLRRALQHHWAVGDQLGAHFPAFSAALKAAQLLALPSDGGKDVLAAGNWARHAPPPGAVAVRPVPVGLRADSLEGFRASLHAVVPDAPTFGCAAARFEAVVARHVELEQRPSFGSAEARFLAAVVTQERLVEAAAKVADDLFRRMLI